MKNKKLYIIIAIITIIILFICLYYNKVTYSLDDDVKTVKLECSDKIGVDDQLECTVSLTGSKNDILSINANYNLPNDFEYVSFTFTNECDNDSCVSEATSNGFAYGLLSGFDENVEIGKFVIKIPDNLEVGSTYRIGLKNIELSDINNQMIGVDDINLDIKISENEVPSDEDYFALQDDIQVDETNSIVYDVISGSKYNDFKEKVHTNIQYYITDANDNVLNDDSVIKTGDKLVIEYSSGNKTYMIAVYGDMNKDGKCDMNDVTYAYRCYKGKITLNDDTVFKAGDVIVNNVIDLNDVTKLYREYIKRKKNS